MGSLFISKFNQFPSEIYIRLELIFYFYFFFLHLTSNILSPYLLIVDELKRLELCSFTEF